MNFFKIIQNKKIVNVGVTFLKWDTIRHRLFVCDIDDGQLIQSYNEEHIYHASWMKPLPTEAGEYELATVAAIDETEFNDLLDELSEGEIPIVEEVEEEPIHEEPQKETEEKPISISEMRKLIVEQQKQIELLMQKM